MIQFVRLAGYKSIRDQTLELGPLNVLIGPNASGKTNFIDALNLLSEASQVSLGKAVNRRGGLSPLLWAGSSPPYAALGERRPPEERAGKITWHIDFPPKGSFADGSRSIQYEISLVQAGIDFRVIEDLIANGQRNPLTLLHRDEGGEFSLYNTKERTYDKPSPESDQTRQAFSYVRDPVRYPVLAKLQEELKAFKYYMNFDTSERALIRRPQTVMSETILYEDGSNLSIVLHNLSQRFPSSFQEIFETAKVAYPSLERLYFEAPGPAGQIILAWKDTEFIRPFMANELSDGTLRFLCLLAILLNPTPPPLTCLEEPELGLHPALLIMIAELLQDASTRTQLIVTTHSPQLVDKLSPDQVVVVNKDESGATSFERLTSKKDLRRWLKKFSLGELWMMGELGGRP